MGDIRRFTRHHALTFSIVGLLAFSAGAFGTTAIAGQEEDLRDSLSELLFKAVRANDINAVRTVVEAGADLSRVNMNGRTAMDMAVDRSHFDIAQYLVFARRIEQQTVLKSTPAVTTFEQVSPEAAPVLDVADTKPTLTDHSVLAQATKPVGTRTNTPIQPPDQPTYDQLMSAAKRLAAAAEALANKSTPAPVITTRKLASQMEKMLPNEVAKAAVKPAAPVYVIGSDGHLTIATAEQIQRASKTTAQQVENVSAIDLPDVEPRKSIFIPKPRQKPNKQTFSPFVRQAALPTSRIPKTSTPRIEVPAFAKPAIPRVSDGTAPQSVQIRPTRRISPQLLDKLRRRLKTKTKRKQTVSDVNTQDVPDLTDAPKILPTNLPRAVETSPLPAIKARPQQITKIVPPDSKVTEATPNTEAENGAVQKLIDGLGSLFGLNSETRKNQQVSENKIEIKIEEEKPEVEISEPAKPVQRIQRIQVQAQPQLTLLPQNSPAGFETRSVATKVKAPPVEVAVAAPTIKPSPRIEIPVATPPPSPKATAPSIMERVKEVLLPGAVVQPKVDASISETANIKARDSSLRRLTRSMPLNRLRKPLKNVLLTLGDSVTTGQTKLPRGIAEPDACVGKRRGTISFCIVPVDWPRTIEPSFAVNTNLYQGTRAIARYDKGKASHFHALYAARDHDKIVEFMKRRYGPPTDIWKRMIAPFGKPRQPNPTYVWRSIDSETDKVTILEVRKFDDSRSVFPDTAHGAIRLYPAGGPPVFPIITAHDIMSIDWAARSDHIDGASPALARTIRVEP